MDVKAEQPRQQHVELAGRILAAAVEMGLGAGGRLPEQALAERCNVSRTPVRKALAILASHGAASTSPDGGFVLAGDPASLREKVAALPSSAEEALIEAILGDLAQRRIGESQTVASLQRRYRVERNTVQNALIKLMSDQLAERAPGQQWLLKATVVTDEAVAQSFDFRMLTEPAALTAPGFRADPAALSALRHVMEALAAADERTFDTEAFERSDHDFHAMIARCCGNAVIGEALINHHRRRRSARLHASIGVFRLIQSTREHLAIVERIERGEFELAADLMRVHLRQSRTERPRITGRGVAPLRLVGG